VASINQAKLLVTGKLIIILLVDKQSSIVYGLF